MLSVAEARARILDGVEPTGPEIVSLADAAGRILASPVAARVDQPARDVSAMDGYAVRAADAPLGATLRVVAAAPAGHPTSRAVGSGEAIRLFTGSFVPDGADAVVIQEDVDRAGDRVTLRAAAVPARNIRPQGGDFAAGTVLLEPGIRLGARAIGLAASAGHPWLAVRRRPRVALLATGDEVVLPGEPIPPGGLPSSNSFALAAFVREAGGDPVILPVARDDRDAIAEIAGRCRDCDLLLTIGGASVGDHDLVQPALARHGFAPDVWKIAMRPGKPLMHGHLAFGTHRVKVIGLPGNPVSALTCALLFAAPAIARLLGRDDAQPRRTRARLGADLPANDARADHLRAAIAEAPAPDGLPVVMPFPVQDSARLRDLARADALILRAPHAEAAPAGSLVEIIPLAGTGI